IAEAINLYLQALDLEPNLPQAQVNLGSMYYLQENWQGAIACYEKALVLQPDFQAAKFNLVKVLERIGKTTEAKQLLEEIPPINNLSAPAQKYWQQAKSLAQSGQLDEAIAHYQEVIKLQPDLPETHCQIGIHLKQQGKWQEALSYLERAIELCPNYSTAYQHLCGIYRDNNNYLLAREYVNRYTQNCQETEPIISQVYLISTYQVAGLNEIAKDRFFGLDQSLKADINSVKTVAEARSLYANFLFSMPYLRDNIKANSQTAQLISDLYIERVISQQGVHNKLANCTSYASNSRLKLGILSNHFNRHSVGWCSVDVIEELSRLPIDIYLYTTAPLKIDDLTNRFAKIAKILHQPL
ncbi:MAG: tetratricopeptide repeat protein, partial [Microcoleaceae cyanobacterium]